jgi:hypothetical protein
VLYQNFGLRVGFIPLYIIDMAQIVFSRDIHDILGVWEDGAFLGTKVVSSTWDSPVVASNLCIYDTSGSRQEAITVGQDAMTSSLSSLPCLSPWFNILTSALPDTSQTELDSVGRVSVSYSELSSCLDWAEGYSEQILKDEYGIT